MFHSYCWFLDFILLLWTFTWLVSNSPYMSCTSFWISNPQCTHCLAKTICIWYLHKLKLGPANLNTCDNCAASFLEPSLVFAIVTFFHTWACGPISCWNWWQTFVKIQWKIIIYIAWSNFCCTCKFCYIRMLN